MNKKGFTLFELLFSIVLVAIISAGSIIAYNKINDDVKIEENNNIYLSIQRAAKLYVDLDEKKTSEFNTYQNILISVLELQESNFISKNIKDPISNNKIPSNYIVRMCANAVATFLYGDVNLDSVVNKDDCEFIDNNANSLGLLQKVVADVNFDGVVNEKDSELIEYFLDNNLDCFNDNNICKKTISYMYGDVNLDGKVSGADATYISRYIVGLDSMDTGQIKIGDFDFDGEITETDANLILLDTVNLQDFSHIKTCIINHAGQCISNSLGENYDCCNTCKN